MELEELVNAVLYYGFYKLGILKYRRIDYNGILIVTALRERFWMCLQSLFLSHLSFLNDQMI